MFEENFQLKVKWKFLENKIQENLTTNFKIEKYEIACDRWSADLYNTSTKRFCEYFHDMKGEKETMKDYA